MATESSVVVALREVRRLELERQKREEDTRLRAMEEERANHEAARRATIQYEGGMAPFANGNGHGHGGQGWGQGQVDERPDSFNRPMRRTTEVVPLAASGGYAEGQNFVQTGPWDNALGGGQAEKKRGGGAFRAAVFTLALCGAGAGFGYVKLNEQFAAERAKVEAEKQKADDARHEAVAERSKAEQALKVKVAELEGKLVAAQAKASALAMVQAARATSPATAAEPMKPAALSKSFAAGKTKVAGRAGGKVARPTAAPVVKAPLPKPVSAAKMAKKRNLSDDPLGGLRL